METARKFKHMNIAQIKNELNSKVKSKLHPVFPRREPAAGASAVVPGHIAAPAPFTQIAASGTRVRQDKRASSWTI